MSLLRNVNINKFDLGFDAWGRNKMISDFSIYHGVFTNAIPSEMWVKYVDMVEDLTINDTAFFYSNNGKATIKGAIGQSSYLMSRRHPRYQPNRGHLYSSSIICPVVNATGTRRWGVFNSKYGAFFELVNGDLYAVVRTTVDDVTTDDRQLITTTFTSLDKGNIYDIQMQWRGVGNIKFFIGNPETGLSEVVSTFSYLNTRTELSISNPALPIGFESIGDVILECGCCDVSSEGGGIEKRVYQSIYSGDVDLTNTEVPVLAFRIPSDVNNVMNTRDCVLTQISAYSDDNAIVSVYFGRNPAAVTATWVDKNQGFQQYAPAENITSVDTSLLNLLSGRRIPANGNASISNPDKDAGDVYLIHDDIILITIKAKNNTTGGAFLEYSEEI